MSEQQPTVDEGHAGIRLEYAISQAMYARAQEQHWKRRKLGSVQIVLWGILAVGLGITLNVTRWAPWLGRFLWPLGVVCFVLVGVRRYRYRDGYRQRANQLRGPILSEFGDRLRQTSPVGTAELDWAAIRAFHETRDFFLLYMTKRNFVFVPKSAMTAEIGDSLRELIHEKIKSRPGTAPAAEAENEVD